MQQSHIKAVGPNLYDPETPIFSLLESTNFSTVRMKSWFDTCHFAILHSTFILKENRLSKRNLVNEWVITLVEETLDWLCKSRTWYVAHMSKQCHNDSEWQFSQPFTFGGPKKYLVCFDNPQNEDKTHSGQFQFQFLSKL